MIPVNICVGNKIIYQYNEYLGVEWTALVIYSGE